MPETMPWLWLPVAVGLEILGMIAIGLVAAATYRITKWLLYRSVSSVTAKFFQMQLSAAEVHTAWTSFKTKLLEFKQD